jgi:hypothetical protein
MSGDRTTYFTPIGKTHNLSKDECVAFCNVNDTGECDNLTKWFEIIKSIRMIKLDMTNWELSTCTCREWSKLFKCKHIIAIAYRAKLCDFRPVLMDLPMERKRARGAKKATKSALDRQSIEPQARYNGIEITEDEQASLPSEVDQNVAQTKRKRAALDNEELTSRDRAT